MTAQGDRTKAALIKATSALVGEVGYHRTTTKAIAERAGISEGTIYRHFPDKRALFFSAVLAGHQPVLEWMTGLPALAGTASLADTLTDCLVRLSQLRESVLPLELALANDRDLIGDASVAASGRTLDIYGGPPRQLAEYLAAEQRLGRVRSDVDTARAAIVLLAALFGLSASPLTPTGPIGDELIGGAVTLFLHGIAQSEQG